jgi:hypothetical protein
MEEVPMHPCQTLCILVAFLLLIPATRAAGDAPLSIAIDTGRGKSAFVLRGRDSWQQLTVTGTFPHGKTRDLTCQATWSVQPAGLVAIDASGLPPSEPCDDATFIRRATIDLAGRLPTVGEVEEFVAARKIDKDEKLIDEADSPPVVWYRELKEPANLAEDAA